MTVRSLLMVVYFGCLASIQSETLPSPRVELNHVYITLERETVDAISASKFISERFAMLDQETTKTTTSSWTGVYLIGWNAYLELFAPGGAEKFSPGSSGLGFSTVFPGEGAEITAGLKADGTDPVLSDLRERIVDEHALPWFDNIRLASLDQGNFSAWLMDFRIPYLAARGIRLGPGNRFDRHQYNAAPYVRSGRMEVFASRALDDIREVHLDLAAEERASLQRFLSGIGYSIAEGPEMRMTREGGAGFFARVSSSPVYRIRKVVCSLRRDSGESAEYVFGPDARLEIRGRTAVWTFGRQSPAEISGKSTPPKVIENIFQLH